MVEHEKGIALKLKWNLDETKINFVNKGISLIGSFLVKDIYLIRDKVDVLNETNENILSQAIIIREINGNDSIKQLICMNSNRDNEGTIMECVRHKCSIVDIEDTYDVLTNSGYKECFRYEQECLEYCVDEKKVLVEYIPELGLFAELKSDKKSIDELTREFEELKIPCYEENYFSKKAELMLNEIKKRR